MLSTLLLIKLIIKKIPLRTKTILKKEIIIPNWILMIVKLYHPTKLANILNLLVMKMKYWKN